MADLSGWERLGQPARAALRWAWAAAATRTDAADQHGGEPDSFDLLVGIILALRPNSQAQILLEHFVVPAGAVFAYGGNRRYDAGLLLVRFRALPVSSPPRLGAEARQIVEYAVSGIPHPDSDVSLPMLFAGFLERTSPASLALREELSRRGVDAEAVVSSYREFLREQRRGYADFLRERHPYRPPGIEVPAFLADQPLRRRPPPQPHHDSGDFIGIRAEVDAFAYLIASKSLMLPLAVGLFGDWGSGKSFFLRSLQRTIDKMVNSPAAANYSTKELPFYRHIAQIEFNAWQYVGGDLWASLLEHLFRNLRTSADEPDSMVIARQKELISRIEAQRIDREQLRPQREHSNLSATQRRPRLNSAEANAKSRSRSLRSSCVSSH
jgi:KAP family P-loop domain